MPHQESSHCFSSSVVFARFTAYATKARKETRKMQKHAQSLKLPSLLKDYDKAKHELETSTSDEKRAKAQAQGTAIFTLRRAHTGAVKIAQAMSTSANTAVAESDKAVREAKDKASEVFEKTAQTKVRIQMQNKGASSTLSPSASAKAQAAAAAAAKAELLKVQAAAATATATNLMNATVKAKQDEYAQAQDDMLKAITDEKGAKTNVKGETEDEIAAMNPDQGVGELKWLGLL